MEKKILIVDDEKTTTDSVGNFFRRRGYDVVAANGGKDALSLIKTTFFPVVIMDIKMPDLYGTEVLKEAVKIQPKSKIIMMTGFGDEDRQECLKMGAYDYVPKPISLKEVFEMVDKLVTIA
jgi:two-component system, OmpR family, response regulator